MAIDRRHHVLIVEDSRTHLDNYTRALNRRGYDATGVLSADAAKLEIVNRLPDIILLDIFMPGVSGFELLEDIRRDPRTHATPVILISGLTDTKHVVEGLQRGANDYVAKPVVMPILTARMEALLRASALVRNLEVQTELLGKLAAFDELTGVYNRRSLFHSLETELSRSQRYCRALSVIMVDLDHFKNVNDSYGHPAGDAVLRDVAQAMQMSLRTMDVVCRFGGEEFCAILPETNMIGAIRAAERVRAALTSRTFSFGTASIVVTASAGVATWMPGEGPDVPDLLANADQALYEAKRRGRNRVCVYDRGELRNP
jgi:two-component system cell cycle response regulator